MSPELAERLATIENKIESLSTKLYTMDIPSRTDIEDEIKKLKAEMNDGFSTIQSPIDQLPQ
jgi:hypothetical protein